jgi:hypothetical protein
MGALISAAIANLLNFFVKYQLATKIILSTLIITVLPIVLWNLLYDLMGLMFSIVKSLLPSNLSLSLQDVSFACWFLHNLKIPEALSVVISASITRMLLSMIPFIGVK